jgi:ABC-type multidrug transport system ATPase subunit
MCNSGSGKTTLLNVLAHRHATAHSTTTSALYVNGNVPALSTFRKLSSYVEQEDALVGSLTVGETLYFAAQLSLPRSASYLSLGDTCRADHPHTEPLPNQRGKIASTL